MAIAPGKTHVLQNAFVKATFFEDATNGVELTEIENLVDGSKLTLTASTLFRLILRDDSDAGVFTTLEPAMTSQVKAVAIEAETAPEYGPDDGLGIRSTLKWVGTFSNVAGGTADLQVAWSASLLVDQPDRIYFHLAYGWQSVDASIQAVFWMAPALLKMAPHSSAHYLLAMNDGMVTRNPTVDLVGDGGAYRFKTAVGFEPETVVATEADRMEAFYPGYLSTPLSAYGDRTGLTTVYIHDTLNFQGTRIRDWYDGAAIVMEHEVLSKESTEDWNNQTVPVAVAANYFSYARYVRVFKAQGAYLGEEVGLDYRPWLLGSVEGRALLPDKPQDRTDRAAWSGFPFMVSFNEGDLETETGLTDDVIDEFLELFPALVGEKFPMYQTHYARFNRQNQYKSAAGGFFEIPRLFDMFVDALKTTQLATLRASHSVQPSSDVQVRQGAEWGPRNIAAGDNWYGSASFDTGGRHRRAGCRIVNSIDKRRMLNQSGGYAGSHSYSTTHVSIVAGTMIYEAGPDETVLTVTIGASPPFDSETRDFYTKYGGVEYLGAILQEGGGGTPNHTALLKRNAAVEYDARIIRLKGNQTGDLDDGIGTESDLLLTYFIGMTETGALEEKDYLHAVFGYSSSGDGRADDVTPHGASCPAGDSFIGGNWPTVKQGPCPQFLLDLVNEWALAGDRCKGIVFLRSSRLSLVCFEDDHHFGPTGTPQSYLHRPATNEPIVGYRTLLDQVRTDAAALQAAGEKDFYIVEEQGPSDWTVGKTDGHCLTSFRRDLTSGRGSWGGASFFPVAFGDWHHGGFYRNELGSGHILGGPSLSTWELLHNTLCESLAADWLFSRKLLTIQVTPTSGGKNTTSNRGGGQDSWTPFNDGVAGIQNSNSGSSFVARMIQVSLKWGIPHKGHRLRSLDRLTTDTVTRVAESAFTEGHDVSPFEEGDTRPPLVHAVFRDPTNTRQILLVFANEHLSVTRGGAYVVETAKFAASMPFQGAYNVTKYVMSATGSVATVVDSGATQDMTLAVTLAPGEVHVYALDFVSGLQFLYRYDNDALTVSPLPSDQDRYRVERELLGSGERFQFGFRTDLPDEDVEITAAMLRVMDLGRSRSQ